DNGTLHLLNGVGDMDSPWTGLRAVKDRSAAPHAGPVTKNLQPLSSATVSAIEDEAMGVDDRGWPHPIWTGPDRGARAGAGATEDTFGGLIVALALLWRLEALGTRLRFVIHQKWLHLFVLSEERLHVHDKVANDWETQHGLDSDTCTEVVD